MSQLKQLNLFDFMLDDNVPDMPLANSQALLNITPRDFELTPHSEQHLIVQAAIEDINSGRAGHSTMKGWREHAYRLSIYMGIGIHAMATMKYIMAKRSASGVSDDESQRVFNAVIHPLNDYVQGYMQTALQRMNYEKRNEVRERVESEALEKYNVVVMEYATLDVVLSNATKEEAKQRCVELRMEDRNAFMYVCQDVVVS